MAAFSPDFDRHLTSLATYPSSGLLIAVFVTVSLYLLLVSQWMHQPRRIPLPPGPKGLPIIGNLLQVLGSKAHPWVMYRDLSKEYGECQPSGIVCILKPDRDIVC